MNMICWISIFDYRTHVLGASDFLFYLKVIPASLTALFLKLGHMIDTTTRNMVSLDVFNGALWSVILTQDLYYEEITWTLRLMSKPLPCST